MDATATGSREVAVPVSIFDTLRRELAKEAGSLPTIHALHAAGYEAGVAAADAFRASGEGDETDLSEEAFWARFIGFFQRRGWGTLAHATSHHAVGFLSSSEWAECQDAEPDPDLSCSFSTGFLSGLLTSLGGGPIAVLEVACRGRGDQECSFAFGSESAVHHLYGQLLEGADLDTALGSL